MVLLINVLVINIRIIPKVKKLNDNRFQVEYSYAFNNVDFPLAVKLEENAESTQEHIHDNFSELVIVTKGKAIHQVRNRKYEVAAGDIFVIGENELHSYSETDNFTYCNILMNLNLLKFPLFDLPTRPGYQTLFVIDKKDTALDRFKNRFRLSSEQLSKVMEMVKKIELSIPYWHFEAIANLMLLIGFLCDCCAENEKNTNSNIPFRLGHIVARMEKQCQNDFSIAEMCKITSLSRSALFRYFNNYFGMSPIEYLINLRIKKSIHLLKNSSLSCGDIALECGFTDASYFAMHFKKVHGVSPAVFRKNNLAK